MVDLQLADVEMLFRKSGNQWSSLISGGVRIADFESREIVNDYYEEQDVTQHFTGYGPTISIEARRHSGCLTPFAKIRGSLLYGDRIGRDNFTGGLDNDAEPAGFIYFEGQLGLEYTKTVECGQFFFRTALESHYSPLMGTMANTGSDNEEDHMHWALIGGTFATGFRF